MNEKIDCLKDFEILREVVSGKIKIEELDIETEKRLILLCVKRLKQIDNKIEKLDKDIFEMQKLCVKLDSLN